MRRKRLIVDILGRVLHALLVLVLSYLLFRAVYYAFSLLANEPPPGTPRPQEVTVDNKPSPQEIAESLNTYWLSWDQDHCRNVCEASRKACWMRDCRLVPGVRQWG
ncbi:hypothetical protein K458DRAFT_394102 [Lentithecium fluviatile CBS 122367]|uniref:Uncharacterized protein n=1 Tax=Lentithecium fluviatile CBS 122367 TaxID=1168545 RepID=A0A6G1ILS1_9PLEO|nr:hypothetical protein K458DRAFT_394102 [Lentithecium fluviatile CBS 122367]